MRSFLSQTEETDRPLARMAEWTASPNAHVRRLASEGPRPRLPWEERFEGFMSDPELALMFVEPLRSDGSAYGGGNPSPAQFGNKWR